MVKKIEKSSSPYCSVWERRVLTKIRKNTFREYFINSGHWKDSLIQRQNYLDITITKIVQIVKWICKVNTDYEYNVIKDSI